MTSAFINFNRLTFTLIMIENLLELYSKRASITGQFGLSLIKPYLTFD